MARTKTPGAVNAFRTQAARHLHQALERRSQKSQLPLDRMNRIVTRWLPPTRTLHPFPEVRFAVTQPRQEPSAVVPHAGICAGGRPQGRSLPRLSPAASGPRR
jgi:RNA-directed DNA polymerase